MSQQLVSTLVTGGFVLLSSLLTLIISQWFNHRSQSRQQQERREERRTDYREWYRRTLFERRLAAVQEAHAWKLRLFYGVDQADYSNPDSEANTHLRQTTSDAREWYDNKTIYIHDELPERSKFVGLTNAALAYANGRTYRTEVSGFDYFYLLVSNMIRERARKLLELESGHERLDEQ